MNVIYEINQDEIFCDEKFIKIKIYNIFELTTEQVKNRPLLDRRNESYSRVVGHLMEADEEYIYGVMYSAVDLYDSRKNSFSMEIVYDGEMHLMH